MDDDFRAPRPQAPQEACLKRDPISDDGSGPTGNSTYDHPHYLCGHWGKPDGQDEVPEPARSLPKSEAPHIRAFETRRFLLVFDDREGKEALVIRDKLSGDEVELDGVGMGITVKATSALLLKADGLVSIEGTSVQINGRLVLPGAKAI